MVMPIRDAVVTTGAIAKSYFLHQPVLRQVPERVVDRGKAESWQCPAGGIKDFGRRRMCLLPLHYREHQTGLPRERRHVFPIGFWFSSHSWNYNNSKLRVKLRRAGE